MKAKIINIEKVDFVGKDKKRIEYKKVGIMTEEIHNDKDGKSTTNLYPVLEPINVNSSSTLKVGDTVELYVHCYKGKLKIGIEYSKK